MKESNKPELFVDNERYDWGEETIKGSEIKELAGAPEGVALFQKKPGQPDVEIKNGDVVNLSETNGPDRFFTQVVGSQAG